MLSLCRRIHMVNIREWRYLISRLLGTLVQYNEGVLVDE